MTQVRVPFQAHCLKAVFSTFCGSEPLGRARRLRCALRFISHLSCKQRSDAVREAIRLQRHRTTSRILPDPTIIQRPDCVVPI